jgi:HD superfamily phosphodiesterase
MLTDENFRELCHYTRTFLNETAAKSDQEWLKDFPRAAVHRWQHTLNVLKNAEQIMTGEGVSDERADVVRAAVILHDISLFTCDHKIHGQVSAEIAERYLLEQGYQQDFVDRVTRAVAEHGTDLGPLPPDEQGTLFSWEGKVVLEADILDKLGASAITDSLLVLGKKEKQGFECRRELAQGRAMQRASFFKDYIWTETGQRLAEQRFSFFLKFLEQLGEEVVETSSPFEEVDRVI